MPRCVECGSTWLKPSRGSKGPDSIASANDAFREQKKQYGQKDG